MIKFAVFLLLAVGLVFAVSRVTDLRTVLNLPKAAERRVSTWELVYGNKTSSGSASRISTWELIFGNRNSSPPATPTPTPTALIVTSPSLTIPDRNYKSTVTAKGNYADFKVTGGNVKDFTDRFNISGCNLTNYAVKGPATVPLTNGSFSFSQNGFIVSGTLDSVTSRLENYPAPECGAGAKVNAGPFTYKVSLQ